jgi:hypothetical protein
MKEHRGFYVEETEAYRQWEAENADILEAVQDGMVRAALFTGMVDAIAAERERIAQWCEDYTMATSTRPGPFANYCALRSSHRISGAQHAGTGYAAAIRAGAHNSHGIDTQKRKRA